MAEEKTYVFGEGAGNNGILSLLGPMLSQKGVDPNVLLAMQGRNNDGFGEGGWFWSELVKAENLLRSNQYNIGITYSNFKHKCSIVVIGLTTSAEEFQNTFDHEKGHLAMHISSALKIKPYGEEYQYLTGEIGQSMFKIAKRFLCDDCRQKLVIEIKEIDKKD